jgi:hypothetical protein
MVYVVDSRGAIPPNTADDAVFEEVPERDSNRDVR